MTALPLLAHIGSPNNPWIGVMTVSAWALMLIFILVLVRKVTIEAPGDLLLPLAAVVLVAGLTGSLGDTINDQGPWAVPIGAVILIALLAAAFRGTEFTLKSRSTMLVLGLAAVTCVAAYGPLSNLWFPQPETLPALEDGVVTAEILGAPDENGTFTIRVTLESATFGDGLTGVRPKDPETGLVPRFAVGPVYLQPPVPTACAEVDDCTTADFELTLPAGFVTDPPEAITVELLTADKLPFSPPMQTTVDLPAQS